MSSIRSRLILYIVAGTAVLLVAAGVAMERLIYRQLAAEFDRGLLDKVMLLASLNDRDGRIIEFDFSYDFMPEFEGEDVERPEYFELWLPDGTLFAKSESLDEDGLPRGDFPTAGARYSDITLPDGREGRMVVLSFAPRLDEEDEEEDDPEAGSELSAQADEDEILVRIPGALPADTPVGIAMARGKESLDDLLGMVRGVLAATGMALMAAVALLVWLCVDRGLFPLKRMATEVRDLDSTKLNTRLRTEPGSEELQPITDQLNHLLERLEEAFEREKRFSGNVAHELRTPIAELRTLAEVGGRWPNDEGMVSGFFGDLVNLADDMERTVTNLLSLARLDAGRRQVELETVDLSDVIRKCWRQVASEAKVREVTLDNRIRDDLRVRTDKDKLTLIVVNLFSNAVAYSRPGSSIVVRTRATNSRIQFSISNLTVDLTEHDLPLMFERFWRKDQARARGRFAGLGLSLVAALGEVLGLKVQPTLEEGGWFTMTLDGLHAS